MAKKIILVHGRHFKPKQKTLLKSWVKALRHGIERDFPGKMLKTFDKLSIDMSYYGDISNEFLFDIGKEYDESEDVRDRGQTLDELMALSRSELNSKSHYKDLAGKNAMKEFLADILHNHLDWVGAADNLIGKVAPDIKQYWNSDSKFGSDVRWPLTEHLRDALMAKDDVLLITHSLGTMIAYDVLWKMTHYREYRTVIPAQAKVTCWITLGSPLGNPTVQDNLKGAKASDIRRYPGLLKRWINIAAEDDYISHDQTLADDFRRMKTMGLVEQIVDKRVYNMAKRGGDERKSNPHHGTGYLVCPAVTTAVAEWLEE